MPNDIPPSDIPASLQPRPHHLGGGGVLRCHVSRGAQLYVAAGDMVLVAPPRLLAGEVHRPRSALPAGHVYSVHEAGWIELHALGPATFLWLAPGQVCAAGRIKGILSAWLRSWGQRSARRAPPATPTTPAPATQGTQSAQAIQGANT